MHLPKRSCALGLGGLAKHTRHPSTTGSKGAETCRKVQWFIMQPIISFGKHLVWKTSYRLPEWLADRFLPRAIFPLVCWKSHKMYLWDGCFGSLSNPSPRSPHVGSCTCGIDGAIYCPFSRLSRGGFPVCSFLLIFLCLDVWICLWVCVAFCYLVCSSLIFTLLIGIGKPRGGTTGLLDGGVEAKIN